MKRTQPQQGDATSRGEETEGANVTLSLWLFLVALGQLPDGEAEWRGPEVSTQRPEGLDPVHPHSCLELVR